ncbi:MAG TPA: hypothetical protein VM076_21470 [Gemmatimonadaceae bacterium]|nr:hypothetical protein [Gemmatimonadaceae bacterium]
MKDSVQPRMPACTSIGSISVNLRNLRKLLPLLFAGIRPIRSWLFRNVAARPNADYADDAD